MAVIAWGGVEPPAEGPVHGLGCSEAAGSGDLLDGPVGALQESAGGFEADGFDVVRRGDAHLGLEDSRELSFRQVDLTGERRQGEIFGEVVAQPGQQVADRFGVGSLPGQETTSWRATVAAAWRPWSAATSARARSMPAVTPAEVQTLPSWTKMASGSTVTSA